MLNYFEEKKETLFEYKKTKFFKVQKIAYLSMLLARKCHFFSFFRFDQNKTRNNTSEFAMKKQTFFCTWKQNFSKCKKSHFFPNGLI